MSDADAVDPLVGRVIGDAYVIQDLIGIGGMGRVYRAEQRALGRVVAIKVVHRHLLGDRESVQRFYTEARAASSLNHPNSVSVFDFGRTDDGMLYLVMEYLRGKDLAQVMAAETPLSMARIVELMLGVLGALGEAHARGVVHRDLKPENVIIERMHGGTDLVKVVDFGLAQIRGGEASESARGLVAGTPDYMAPEQARGLDVDGRGDLYALGVVLFELLTGRLPYIDETPAKVMLKHVIDPIPNAQEIAPYRGIPDALAQITVRALQKEPAVRYQDADQMAAALRQVAQALRTNRDRVRCPRCGALTENQRAFCGDCGMRLSTPSTQSGEFGFTMPPPGESPLLGRTQVFDQLVSALRETSAEARIAYLVGELGIGKTRLLTELSAHAEREGWLVIESGPHESGALVPYAAIRRTVARLLNVTEERLATLADDASMWRDRVAHAGVHELVQPEGVPGHEGRSRAGAVAAALARAVSLGSSRSGVGRVLLVFDDLSRCDGLSADVIAAFRTYASALPVFVAVGMQVKLPLCTRWKGTLIELGGLTPEQVAECIGARATLPEVALGGALPLHLAQLRALGWVPTPDEPDAPSLAEAVTRRLLPLAVTGRRVLQALAVLGDRAPLATLRTLVEPDDLASLDKLTEQGFLRVSAGEYVFAHPYLRDVVEASTPAETRKHLHASALDLASVEGKPVEVRAEHAGRGGDVWTGLMLLERMGQDALKRGDPLVGVYAFRHGLELARRELLDSGDEALDRAIVSFSRQLGEAMVWSGDIAGAAGVLNESIALAGPASLERARMTLVLGRVAERRERAKEAAQKLELAAELAQQLGDQQLESRALWALARVRKAQGDDRGAVEALLTGLERLVDHDPRSARRCRVEIDLAEMLADLGDTRRAADHLDRALDLARDGEWQALEAAALGVLASIDELAGQPERALTRYREACVLAAHAGDLVSRDRWGRAAQALSS